MSILDQTTEAAVHIGKTVLRSTKELAPSSGLARFLCLFVFPAKRIRRKKWIKRVQKLRLLQTAQKSRSRQVLFIEL